MRGVISNCFCQSRGRGARPISRPPPASPTRASRIGGHRSVGAAGLGLCSRIRPRAIPEATERFLQGCLRQTRPRQARDGALSGLGSVCRDDDATLLRAARSAVVRVAIPFPGLAAAFPRLSRDRPGVHAPSARLDLDYARSNIPPDRPRPAV